MYVFIFIICKKIIKQSINILFYVIIIHDLLFLIIILGVFSDLEYDSWVIVSDRRDPNLVLLDVFATIL